jgi:hypothetical protein
MIPADSDQTIQRERWQKYSQRNEVPIPVPGPVPVPSGTNTTCTLPLLYLWLRGGLFSTRPLPEAPPREFGARRSLYDETEVEELRLRDAGVEDAEVPAEM